MSKGPFVFEYSMPTSDWYTTIHKEIEWEDYLYFKIQYRFGPSIWLLGYKAKNGRFEHEEVELGRLSKSDLKKFVEWCGYESFGRAGSKLIGASVISTDMNFPKFILEMFKEGEK